MPTGGRPRARYWLLTIPFADWAVPENLPEGIQYIKGQQEIGHGENQYHHWQLLAVFRRDVRLTEVKRSFCDSAHAEPSRSAAADAYVWKEDTRVPDSQFELGRKALKRNNTADWDAVREHAKAGRLDEIPADIYVRYYGSLCRIAADNQQPVAIERRAYVFWGPTGTGKSRDAWALAGPGSYGKDPRTKFWEGYRGHQHVVVDEFRGGIDIAHVLRWLDRYPVNVEVKGSSRPLAATTFWFTSNIHPSAWYPDLDPQTFAALERRLIILSYPLSESTVDME